MYQILLLAIFFKIYYFSKTKNVNGTISFTKYRKISHILRINTLYMCLFVCMRKMRLYFFTGPNFIYLLFFLFFIIFTLLYFYLFIFWTELSVFFWFLSWFFPFNFIFNIGFILFDLYFPFNFQYFTILFLSFKIYRTSTSFIATKTP